MVKEEAVANRKGDRAVPADQKLMYYVLIYHDGCTLIPHSWVNIDERTYVWPAKPIRSRPRMHELEPDHTWGSLKYTKHLGPYTTFQEVLKIEEICSTNVSSTEDSEAIQSTVNKFLHSKKRIIKPTIAYSPTDNKPPSKYTVRENQNASLGKHNQDTDAMPSVKYVVGRTKEDETRTPNLFSELDSDASNEREHLATENAESPLTPPRAGKSSPNEGQRNCDISHLRIREEIILTELPPSVQAILRNNRKDKSSTKQSRADETPFDEQSTESNNTSPGTPKQRGRKRKHHQKSTDKGYPRHMRIMSPEMSDHADLTEVEYDHRPEKPHRVYERVQKQKVSPNQSPRPTNKKNQAHRNKDQAYFTNDTQNDEGIVQFDIDHEVHSEAETTCRPNKPYKYEARRKELEASPCQSLKLLHDKKHLRRTNEQEDLLKEAREVEHGEDVAHHTMEHEVHSEAEDIRSNTKHRGSNMPKYEMEVKKKIQVRRTGEQEDVIIGQGRFKPRSDPSDVNKCADCHSTCCAKSSTLLTLLVDKVNLLLGGRMDDDGLGDDGGSVLPKFPIETMADLRAFDRLLAVENVAQEEFKRAICMIGGRNLQKFVKNVLEHLLTDKLAKKYTWTGIRNTNKVKHMKFISLMTEALVRKVKGSTRNEVLDAAQEWFRRAGDRIRTSEANLK